VPLTLVDSTHPRTTPRAAYERCKWYARDCRRVPSGATVDAAPETLLSPSLAVIVLRLLTEKNLLSTNCYLLFH
jgi:hypothetical protein